MDKMTLQEFIIAEKRRLNEFRKRWYDEVGDQTEMTLPEWRAEMASDESKD